MWDFTFHNAKQYPHHDAAKMPNGNVLMVVWDKKTADQAIAAGRKKELVSDYVFRLRSSQSSRPARPPEKSSGNGISGITSSRIMTRPWQTLAMWLLTPS